MSSRPRPWFDSPWSPPSDRYNRCPRVGVASTLECGTGEPGSVRTEVQDPQTLRPMSTTGPVPQPSLTGPDSTTLFLENGQRTRPPDQGKGSPPWPPPARSPGPDCRTSRRRESGSSPGPSTTLLGAFREPTPDVRGTSYARHRVI